MFAFLSHTSACEALRMMSDTKRTWPAKPRLLPQRGDCLSTQHDFANLAKTIDLDGLGVTSRPVHFVVPSSSARSRGKRAKFHVWGRAVPAGSFMWLRDNLLVSGPELTVIQLCGVHVKLEPLLDDFVATVKAEEEVIASLGLDDEPVVEVPLYWERVRSLVNAAVVACEFAGHYRLPTGNKDTNYQAPSLMTCASLKRVAQSIGSRSMEKRASDVARIAFDNSKSPMETSLALMLTLPIEFGGFGLPRPKLNRDIDVSGWRGSLSDRNTICVDMWWEGRNVALEYDSSSFHGKQSEEARRTSDAIRSNILASLGCCTLRATPGVIRTLEGTALLARQIATRIGVEPRQPTDIEEQRRTKLFKELMPRVSDELGE